MIHIVLIHGFGFDQNIWKPVEMAFDGYPVISLSLPGFGNDAVPLPYTIPELASCYWKDLDRQHIETIHLIGHSMGGYVLMEMLAQNPDRVAGITLVHSHVYQDSSDRKQSRNDTIRDIEINGRTGFAKKMISSLVGPKQKENQALVSMLIDRGLQYTDYAWMAGPAAMRDRQDHEATLRLFNGPVQLLMGDQDPVVPVSTVFKMASLCNACDLHLYKDVAHLGMYEATAEMIRDLRTFLLTNYPF